MGSVEIGVLVIFLQYQIKFILDIFKGKMPFLKENKIEKH